VLGWQPTHRRNVPPLFIFLPEPGEGEVATGEPNEGEGVAGEG